MMRRSWPGIQANETRVVIVEAVDEDGTALCVDQFRRQIAVPTAVRRAKGLIPTVGERWILDRSLNGQWTFAGVVGPIAPRVEGNLSDGTALYSLLEALDTAGLIVNDVAEDS